MGVHYSGVATFTRVCVYDRAGYGWSETAAGFRTTGNIVQELRLLLRNAEIEPPFVLVGHSFGGLVVQLYAARLQDEVAVSCWSILSIPTRAFAPRKLMP